MQSENATNLRTRRFEVAGAFLKLGALGYGGPAIFGLLQADLQEKRGWLSKERFLEGMALVHALPGAAAVQMCIFAGYQRAGRTGGLLAGLGFMLPAFFIMLALTMLHSAFGMLPALRNAFYGLGPVVLGIYIVATWRLGQNAIRNLTALLIAAVAGLAVALSLTGIAGTLFLAGSLGVALKHSRKAGLFAALVVLIVLVAERAFTAHFADLGAAGSGGSGAPTLLDIGAFFLKVGAVSFGGGITMLAFVQDQVVNQLHWITASDFIEGLTIGQFTPGPIVMLAAFIGYKAAGVVGATVAAVAIFLPSFVLMLSILPVLERFRSLGWVKAAMSGIAPAVVGTICVSIVSLAPHAAPDGFTAALLVFTVAGMLLWRTGPLRLLLGGALAGIGARSETAVRMLKLT
jgi:chromate transporter